MAPSWIKGSLFISVTCHVCVYLSCGMMARRLSIPHNAKPGFSITNLVYWGQSFKIDDSIRHDLTQFFSVLKNGEIITVSDISSLVGQKITLPVLNNLASESWRDAVHLQVQHSDNMLVFPKKLYTGYVSENMPPGAIVEGLADLQAETTDDSKSVTYMITGGPTDLFKLVDLSDNLVQLETTEVLDREQQAEYTLTIRARTDNPFDEPAFTKVRIVINDTDDNVPEFEQSEYKIEIPDTTPVATTVLKVKAIDPDEGQIKYILEDPLDLFTINPTTGSILLSSLLPLKAQSYDMNVYAEDSVRHRAGPISIKVIVEGPLVYESKSNHIRRKRETRPLRQVEIPESYNQGDIVDLDNDYYERFHFKPPMPKNLTLDTRAGIVRIENGKYLDYEQTKVIDFTVVITRTDDATYRDEQPIRIKLSDVNDEVPDFKNLPSPFLATVPANAAPGTFVYQLMADDKDEDSAVKYILESGGEDRFEVDEETGVVRTRGKEVFPHGKEYEIGVSAQDVRASYLQKSPTYSLKILVGERDPQFFEKIYRAKVPETALEQFQILEVKAFSHQKYPITYELTTESGGQSNEFAISQKTGVVDLLRKLDYEKDMQQYHLRVKAVENGRPTRTSTVSLIIDLVDMNDNAPTFPLSQYIVQGIAETVSVGTDIIQVTATDLDSVTNAQLTYSVSDANFSVQTLNNIGYIKTAKRLDYDNIPDHTYNFTILATDNGTPTLSGTAVVRVTVTNVNDEDPIFTQNIEHVQVSEDAPLNTVVHVMQAYDPDGDDVAYSFADGKSESGPFSIDHKSGIITLVGNLDKRKVSYRLNVTATDNGQCCGGTTSRSSKALVIIEIKDINNNAPRFPDCNTYNPTVLEKENVGTSVIQVKAVDQDTGANGNVSYSIVKSNDQSSERFQIEPISGILRTADIFDREGQIGVTDYGVTIKAEDQGNPSLAGFCTFRVKIGDTNDNPPIFNLPAYSTSIEENSVVGKRVKQVYATDRDAGDNGKVEYFIEDDPSGFFTINKNSGWVTVARPMAGWDEVTVVIKGVDKGTPPKSSTVTMTIEITQTMNAYPQWVEDYSSQVIRLSENVSVNEIIQRVKATSSIPDAYVNYVIQPGETPEQNSLRSFYYRIDEKTNEMLLMTYKPLDYETLSSYTLTIKAANRATNSLHNDTRIRIELIDVNDEIPQFIGLDENGRYSGSVAENLAPGAEVITVTAMDKDELPKFNKISYRIKQLGPDWTKFNIDSQTGLVRTLAAFDRERKNEYYITVVAEDGAPSDRHNHYPPNTPNMGEAEVQVRVTDMNDNTPYFEHSMYTARVPENSDSGAVIITVTAKDKDEENRLTYSITDGNVGNAFEVVPELGEIKVRGHLDYEKGPREYYLVYRVFDDKFANSTTVVIQILDVNDNPPIFDNAIYNHSALMEEEPGISRGDPKYLLTVRATDPDIARHSNIRYSLTGQFADDGTFIIQEHTGEIYVTRSLDRDYPRGRPVWNFNVLAHDEVGTISPSLTGYAEVRVMPHDINDNAPFFDRNRLEGSVPENSRARMTVLTVIASDVDQGNNGSVQYSLKQVPTRGSQPMFSINSHTGLISTMLDNVLDREDTEVYYLIVQAKDKGSPPQSSSATVTIRVTDVNDHPPQFTQHIYEATMSENFPPGASITSVSATDKDIGINAKLIYILKEEDREYFSITSVEATNTGVLKVFQPVDYDTLRIPVFNLTVKVQDPDSHNEDTAYIKVQVTDYNDNAPVFVPNSKKVTIFENSTRETTLYRFSATDRDTGPNREFTYSIDRATDPHRQFAVDGNGLVTIAAPLDRETLAEHRVHVLAVDKGTPPMTGTGTLMVTLMDINDNFPVFAEDYRPVVYENEPPGKFVIEISARDADTASHGPPFEFWLPCGNGCPCKANPTCGKFDFKFKQGGGENGYGSGIITALKEFDREQVKEYYMPIIMVDSGKPPRSGTNTLTIVIGDKNDGLHYPGHKNIFVYNYKGEFEDAPLGNVYAADADDWDVVNKTFTFHSKDAQQHFRLDQDTGELYMRGRVTEDEYHFEVTVYDRVHKHPVISSVTVTIKDIGDDAVLQSGSIRLQGMTAEEFINRPHMGPGTSDYGKSPYDILRREIASKLMVPTENVDIFTVFNHPTLPKTVDVRFSAHGSPYYHPSKLDGIVNQHKEEFEAILGLKIVMVPIDECVKEICESGGCSNILKTTSKPHLINTNGTSIVGVTSYIEAECVCMARTFKDIERKQCRPDSCYNGGTCNQRESDYFCSCPRGFDGPRCQQLRHSFGGDGWAWYKPLAQCQDSHTSLEILTTHPDGVIFYNGPSDTPKEGEEVDFILLELKGGYPYLRINHGSGETQLAIDGRDRQDKLKVKVLNDGRWRRIDIFRTGKMVRMVVDQCQVASEEETRGVIVDRRACEAQSETPSENQFLNVHTPLELGGRSHPDSPYPERAMKQGFHGCIKNFVHNGELYDLHIGRVGEHSNSHDACPDEDSVCGSNDIYGPKCGVNGTCVADLRGKTSYCVCNPGWRGPKCSMPTTTKDFRDRSFIEWDFKTAFYEELERQLYRTNLQLMFRTRQPAGLLFKAQNAQKSEYLMLEIVEQKIRFRYNLGGGQEIVELSHVNISDGQWHTVYVERVGQWVVLKLDSGEGPYFNETFGIHGGHLHVRVSQRSLFAGGDVRFPSSDSPPLVDYDYRDSCMNDVRYNGEWLPMDESQNQESRAADFLSRSRNLEDGCESEACADLVCYPPLTCMNFWRYAECRCPPGQTLVEGTDNVCRNIDECIINPCYHGQCIDRPTGFDCDCYAGYTGDLCAATQESATAFISTGAILAIIICALVFLLVTLLFIVYSRRRRPDSYVVGVDPDDDVRENIINYDEEGVGEEDQDAYDINRLKKPVDEKDKPSPTKSKPPPVKAKPPPVTEKSMPPPQKEPPRKRIPPPKGDNPDVGDFINNRLKEADEDPFAPPHDSVREYAYEGGGSDAGSLSSLASTASSEDQEYNYLNNWGPRFQKLADMYGGQNK